MPGEASQGQYSGPKEERKRPGPLRTAAGGAVLAALAAYFIHGGLNLGLGTPFRPGTGAFPAFAGAILIVLAVLVIVEDLRDRGPIERPDWISFAAIGGALAAFALTADRFGLLPAAVLATLVASAPDRGLPLWRKAALGLGMAMASYVIFIVGLGLPFKAFRGM